MTEQNLPQNIDQVTGEIQVTEQIIEDTPEYTIVKTADGKYKKNMKYERFHSRVAETEEEMIELYNVFNDQSNDLVTPLKNMVKKDITIAHVFTDPYQSFDEETGNVTNGVTTTIQDVDGNYYATSSKSVYYTIRNLFKSFGYPSDPEYKPLLVTVTGEKRVNGVQINLSFKGFA